MTPIGTSQSSALAGTLTPEALFLSGFDPETVHPKNVCTAGVCGFPASLAMPRVYANIAQFGDTNRCQIPFAWHDVDTIFSPFNGFSDMNLIEFFIS